MGMTVAEYIAAAPPAARKQLRAIRATIRKAVPGVTERISYRIPVFELEGKYLLYMAAFREHVGVYPNTKGMLAKHGRTIAKYRRGKGTMRFSLDEPLPLSLIGKLAKVRVAERRAAR